MHATLMFFAAVGAITAIILLIVPVKAEQRSVWLTVSFLAMAVFGLLVATRPALFDLDLAGTRNEERQGQRRSYPGNT
ncbi:hypothetical protein [Caballeronia telluris]|uniref:hypothetical protein n=1 Tax=Caballeronia telluris TaxID=326475 RepID=UPI001F45F650|nr:hypothetical protein [Caballeronia telluris]